MSVCLFPEVIFVSGSDNRRVVREEGGPVCRVSDRSLLRAGAGYWRERRLPRHLGRAEELSCTPIPLSPDSRSVRAQLVLDPCSTCTT